MLIKLLDDKFFIVLFAFLISGIVEFIVRNGGGFTLAAFIFYGIFRLAMEAIKRIAEHEKNEAERKKNRSY